MSKRPNILVFMTDQQLGDTILPTSRVLTPNLDRLKARGVQFTQAYCPSPHCCPSRASFFTGLYPSEHGVWHNVEVNNAISRDVYDNITMFPEELKAAGYNTYFSGKWHVSAFDGPGDRGFDNVLNEHVSNYGRMSRDNVPHYEDWDNFYSDASKLDTGNEENGDGRIVRPGYPTYYQYGTDENPFGDNDIVRVAEEAIQEYNSDEPFFMYVGTVGPHDPYCPPQKYLDMYDINDIRLPESFNDSMEDKPALYRRTKEQFRLTEQEHKESLRRYMAFCTYEDALFGQLLDALEQKGMMDDTVILYLSDHGDYAGAHGLWAKGLPCFREAYNISCVVGGYGIKNPGRLNEDMISLVDFAPTILEAAGVKSEAIHSGSSLMPMLTSLQTPDDWRREMYTQSNGNEVYGIQRAVWNSKWKYVYNSFDYDELYNLEDDPHEINNLISAPEHQHVVKKMCSKMWRFAKEHHDGCTCPYIMVALAPYGPGITLECED